ncbi:MAG: hypothetical protein WDO71_00115 [Bacteroidota bacterium]
MKKIIAIAFPAVFFCLPGFAQLGMWNYVFPNGISYDGITDTNVLIKREIILKEKIRTVKINKADLKLDDKSFSSQTLYFNSSGNVTLIETCFEPSDKRYIAFCVKEKWHYSDNGELERTVYSDGRDTIVTIVLFTYVNPFIIKTTAIAYRPDGTTGKPDTLVDYKYMNDKGQVTKVTYIRKEIVNSVSALLFYNKDGLMDSMSFENSTMKTLVFKRHESKKKTILELEHSSGISKWTYNKMGQCIEKYSKAVNPASFVNPIASKFLFPARTIYTYNSDGTIAEMNTKTDGKLVYRLTYSYTR